ncbi:MAG TPA: hypothetical protein VGF38_07240 [Ktedonobacterales bacterium]|jgi:hypothetical protein
MTTLDWILSMTFFLLYFAMIFTVCFLTFQKGHWVLGIVGIFLPILWLIGAILPAKRGSRYEIQQAMRDQAQIAEMTS